MILYDTPFHDAVLVMLSEWEKVTYFINRNEEKIKKHFRELKWDGRNNVFTLKYTVPASGNTYTIVTKPNIKEGLSIWSFTSVNGENNKRKIFVLKKNEGNNIDELMTGQWILDIYTGHFLSRYKERTGSVLYGEALLIQYLENNATHGMSIPAWHVNPAINEKENPNEHATIVKQGLVFCSIETIQINGMKVVLNENKTFVSKDDLFFKQDITCLATDWLAKKYKLEHARKMGLGTDELMEIMNSGFFKPV